MPHRPLALATALALTATLFTPVGAAAAEVDPDTLLGSGPLGGGTTISFERPAGLSFTRVVDLGEVVFAVTEAGALYGWGENGYGQTGTAISVDTDHPVAVTGTVADTAIEAVFAGRELQNVYAIDRDGGLHAWGRNFLGQLGDGTTQPRVVPFRVAGGLTGEVVTKVVSHYGAAIALTADGKLYSWGDNRSGTLGDGTTEPQYTPTLIDLDPEWGAVVDVDTINARVVAVTDSGWLLGWGAGGGQLGDGTTEQRPSPTVLAQLPTGADAVTIVLSEGQTFVRASSGELYSWGDNAGGETGTGSTGPVLTPQRAALPDGARVASVQPPFTLTTTGEVYGWGPNATGLLGDGTTTTQPTPVRLAALPGDAEIEQLAVSAGSFALARDTVGRLYSWGANDRGQLGHGATSTVTEPRAVTSIPSAAPIADIAVAADGAFAVTDSGAVYAWGDNAAGQLGLGAAATVATPTLVSRVGDGAALASVSAARGYALAATGLMWGWGARVGGGFDDIEREPVPVNGVQLASVTVGGTAVNPINLSTRGTEVTATTPPGAAGVVPVVVDYQLARLPQTPVTVGQFRYGSAPAVVTNPVAASVAAEASHTFTTVVTSTEPVTVCWQYRAGSSWTECVASTQQTRVGDQTTARYTLTAGVTLGPREYRASLTNAFGTSYTDTATLTTTPGVWGSTPAPTVTGSGRVGEALWVPTPTWAIGATELRYEWKRDGAVIARTAEYRPTEADLGRRLTVELIGVKEGYLDKRVSSAAITVLPRGVVTRIAGADRYRTSSAISNASYPTSRGTVFIASGRDFPDALAGAALAGESRYGSPVLLTDPTALPSGVRAELQRLRPQNIVILGGEGAVSSRVQTQLRSYAPAVGRLSGSDRYATAASISSFAFGRGVDVAYIANGANFPDALSGAAAAGHRDSPILLTTRTGLPPATVAELQRLRPKRIVVLGGTGVISSAVQTALRQYTTGGVTRLSGVDRYATSVAISAATFARNVPVAYIADGANFPDALSGAAAAGAAGGPVLLTPRGSLPATVARELERLNPGRIIVLGGTGAVSSTVLEQLRRL